MKKKATGKKGLPAGVVIILLGLVLALVLGYYVWFFSQTTRSSPWQKDEPTKPPVLPPVTWAPPASGTAPATATALPGLPA